MLVAPPGACGGGGGATMPIPEIFVKSELSIKSTNHDLFPVCYYYILTAKLI